MDWESLGIERTKRPSRPANEPGHINLPTPPENSTTGTGEATTAGCDLEDAKRYHLEMGKRMQQQLVNGGHTVWTLNKAIRDKRPPEEIALVAVKVVSLLIMEQRIYDSIKDEYRERYQITLDEKCPHEIIHLQNGDE